VRGIGFRGVSMVVVMGGGNVRVRFVCWGGE
jgi:hypothetical protein